MAFNPNIKLSFQREGTKDLEGGMGMLISKKKLKTERSGELGDFKISKREIKTQTLFSPNVAMDNNGNLTGGLTTGGLTTGGLTTGGLSLSTKKASFSKEPRTHGHFMTKEEKKGRRKDKSKSKSKDAIKYVEDANHLLSVASAPASQLLTNSAPALTTNPPTGSENEATKDATDNDETKVEEAKDEIPDNESPKDEEPENTEKPDKPKKSILKFGDAEEIPDPPVDQSNTSDAKPAKADEIIKNVLQTYESKEKPDSAYEKKDTWEPSRGILKNRKFSLLPDAADKAPDLKVIGAPKITIDPAEDNAEQRTKKKKPKRRIKFAAKERDGDIYPWPE